MKHEITEHGAKGRILWLRDEKKVLGIALDYGIRILHLSCTGCDNLFYTQPEDLSDDLSTPEGWRIYGGHRYWTAPESEKSYYPDNDPVSYELTETGVTLTQKPDPWLGVEKQLRVTFCPDGTLLLLHSIRNVTDKDITCASWGVTTFDGGGKGELLFDGGQPGAYNPQRKISLWGDSCLSDERVLFASDRIFVTHKPLAQSYKIGLYSHSGLAFMENKGQKFCLSFEADAEGTYPDGGCNFELYLDKHVMELEALGQLRTIKPNEQNTHWERWAIEPA